MKQLKYSAILELRNREVALNFSGNVELLRSILKAAFPIQRLEAAGVSDFYAAVGNGEWTYWSHSNPTGKPDIDIPIKPMDYFFEHSGMETAKRIAENSTYGNQLPKNDFVNNAMKFTTQCGQEVFLSPKDIECISQFKPKVKEVEMTEAEFEEFMDSKGWPEPTKHANRMNFSGILKSETVTQYSYPVKLSQ